MEVNAKVDLQVRGPVNLCQDPSLGLSACAERCEEPIGTEFLYFNKGYTHLKGEDI